MAAIKHLPRPQLLSYHTALAESSHSMERRCEMIFVSFLRPPLRVGIVMEGRCRGQFDHRRRYGVSSAFGTNYRAWRAFIQAAAYETVPKRLSFAYENLGEQSLVRDLKNGCEPTGLP